MHASLACCLNPEMPLHSYLQGRFKVYEGDEPPPFRCGGLRIWAVGCQVQVVGVMQHVCMCALTSPASARPTPLLNPLACPLARLLLCAARRLSSAAMAHS